MPYVIFDVNFKPNFKQLNSFKPNTAPLDHSGSAS
jgi:hypothetical protein